MAKLIAQIPDDLYAQVKAEAERDERSITAIVRRALRAYFPDSPEVAQAASEASEAA